jgi:hypothetical protein
LVVGAALLLILALGAFYFADIAAGYATGEKLDLEIITRMSVVIFLGSLAVGASAVALSEVS